MESAKKTNQIHLGRKISRIRELRGMKQESLATELGISQQAISKLEQSEEIEDSTLEKVAKVLGVSAEAIKSYTDDMVINYINNFNDSSINHGPLNNYNCTFNPLDELIKALNANKELYERLLASEKEKVELLKNR
ncbi:helix-turn-helix transcriptional regulator [Pedobacter sp. CFBP9032]|uniref:helix-turn-helix domain-containing protein n=1 Tax=Pedobacter sp. CFBP9032 TaxID=3096539 RepID=UPI002A6ACE16|nr:helix-turn-helix transcriptional regulator [Pedobacter sp. CFBP9032]MDY0903889.1 helix-turn-helix transcriptional regulator [Pedobacter sp. CFBP9032]